MIPPEHSESPQQMEMSFQMIVPETGYEQWQEQRRTALEKLAVQLGLPLGRSVEIWLRDGVRLRGKLLLRDETLWVEEKRNLRLELMVGRATFLPTDIESCVRLD